MKAGQSCSVHECFEFTGTFGGCAHQAVIGSDAGHGATIGVVIKATVGIPKLDPCPLGFKQLLLAGGRQVCAEGFVGFVESGILQFFFGDDALNHAACNAAGLVHASGELFAGASLSGAGRVGHVDEDECG